MRRPIALGRPQETALSRTAAQVGVLDYGTPTCALIGVISDYALLAGKPSSHLLQTKVASVSADSFESLLSLLCLSFFPSGKVTHGSLWRVWLSEPAGGGGGG